MFLCQLDEDAGDAREALMSEHNPTKMLAYMETQLDWTPLQILARAVSRSNVPAEVAIKLSNSYNSFLALMDDEESRKHLAGLRPENIAESPVWKDVRKMSAA
jgi:hypothetical protein